MGWLPPHALAGHEAEFPAFLGHSLHGDAAAGALSQAGAASGFDEDAVSVFLTDDFSLLLLLSVT